MHNAKRDIVCLNQRQARKVSADRQAIIDSLEDQLKKGANSLVGNNGYRRDLKDEKSSARIDTVKVEAEARFDEKWVLTADTNPSAKAVTLKYKDLWQVERVFRHMKSMLETRPVYHQNDANIRALKQIEISEAGARFVIRSQCKSYCVKSFQAVKGELPSNIKEVK